MSDRVKWFDAETATKADIPGSYCLAFNAEWSQPQVRVGFYDVLASHTHGGTFTLIGGIYMEQQPTHIARLPESLTEVCDENAQLRAERDALHFFLVSLCVDSSTANVHKRLAEWYREQSK